jgi:CubicO group peptidase (beta-lactamase class C family)
MVQARRSLVALVCAACHTTPAPAPVPAPAPTPVATPTPAPAPAPEARETLTADTPRATHGATFIAPAGWRVSERGPATILEAPEPDSRVAIIDITAADADAAVAAGWAAFQSAPPRKLKLASPLPDREGWVDQKQYIYETSPNEKRVVVASALRSGSAWTVVIIDLAEAVAEKRGSQLGLMFGKLLPKDHARESFAGKPAHPLDAARIAALTSFVDHGREALGVPGVALGLIAGGKVVFAGGFGHREIGKPAAPDADTLFMIASNTKQLTTLLLAKLVDAHKLDWDTPVTQVLPTFKLGDPDTTRSVRVKHLVCACTGLPRQDFEWLMEYAHATPETAMASLATMQPTSKFGEMFQYSNLLAAAGGYVAGTVALPGKELGAAYDAAMQAQVFGPLGMTSTTFDYARALRKNHAGAYDLDIDGKLAPSMMAVNYAAIPVRPAGAAWSNVRDLVKYVQMELAKGALPDGTRYIGEEALLAREKPQVALDADSSYGMGLIVDRTWGTRVVHHGGDLVGYHSDLIWLPEHGVGLVILTNAAGGATLRGLVQRKLLEVLFDGQPLADRELAAAAEQQHARRTTERAELTVPAAAADADKLAAHYHSDALGDLDVIRDHGKTVFDLGEWKSEVASRHEADGSLSFVTIAAGMAGVPLVVGPAGDKRSLIVRDGQHEYRFVEK